MYVQLRVVQAKRVAADETLVEISTDKVDVELPSPATGTVSDRARVREWR